MTAATLPECPADAELAVAEDRIAEPQEHYEVVDGLIIEERPLGTREVWIASVLAEEFVLFNAGKRLGKSYEEMLFVLAAEPRLRRRPDLAFVSAERWPVDRPAPSAAAWDLVPDLAVEIISPTDPVDDLMSKIDEYFAAGVRLVWVVHPRVGKLYAYASPQAVQILDAGDDLDGGAVLPGFRMPLAKIFVADPIEPGPPAV